MNKPVILTGIRANSKLTLGNYLGAVMPLVDLQHKYKGDYSFNIFIPDLHSITTPITYQALQDQIINNLKTFIAAGLDIHQADTYIYRQSYIKAHSEMTWLLSCLSYFGELSRMTQFKDKQANQESVSVGLFLYPVLMAADILLYDAQYIPLGEDQRQHLELARDLAIRINNKFKQSIFTTPANWQQQLEFMNLQTGARIRSLKNPEAKMSKSVDDPTGTILIDEPPEEAIKKITAATTDSYAKINYDFTNQPGISNLIQLVSILKKEPLSQTINEWSGKTNYGDLKKTVADLVYDLMTTYQSNYKQLKTQDILTKLSKDEQHISKIADEKLSLVQSLLGLR